MKKYLPGEPLPQNIRDLRDVMIEVQRRAIAQGHYDPEKGFYCPKDDTWHNKPIIWPNAATDGEATGS